MRLVHYSATPVGSVYPVEQPVMPPRAFAPKPKGLWVSDEDAYGWSQWCRDEDFGTERLEVAHEITLADEARVLFVHDAAGIDDFTRTYGETEQRHGNYFVDWPAVARRFHGIVITPYIAERRICGGADWYYPWDCASGCIWDPAAIASIRVVEMREAS